MRTRIQLMWVHMRFSRLNVFARLTNDLIFTGRRGFMEIKMEEKHLLVWQTPEQRDRCRTPRIRQSGKY